MAEQRLQEKQFDLLYEERRRIAEQLEAIQHRLEALETLGPAVLELSRLSGHSSRLPTQLSAVRVRPCAGAGTPKLGF